MHCLKKLNQILQSNITLIILFITLSVYIILNFNIKNSNLNIDKFNGVLVAYKIDGDKLSMQLKNKQKIIANYYIKTESEKKYLENNLELGYTIKTTGSVNEPVNNTIPNNFNYKKYLQSKNINLIMNTKTIKIIKKNNIFYKLKNFIIKMIDNRNDSKYFYTFILGDKSFLESDVYNLYKTNGITHLFAISGMHISMLILIFNKLKFNNKFIVIFLYIYSFLVMFTPSVLRVSIFYTLKNINLFKDFNNSKLLFYTAFILILINPFLILDVGFQYSFIITLGLFLIKPKGIISLSIYAFLLSLPITLYNNFEFNLISIFINILIVPFVSYLVYPFLLLAFIFPFLDSILHILIVILEYSNFLLEKLSFIITTGKMNLIIILMYYFFLILFVKTKSKKLFLFLPVLVVITKFSYLFNSNYYVYYLDVGQGDCEVIISPKHKDVVMIDTGGKINYQKEPWQEKTKEYKDSEQLITFLKSFGITKITKLIVTHGDYDHMGEAINLVNNFKVEKVIFNCGDYNNLEKELIEVLNKKKIKYYSCIKELNIDDNKLYFLNTKEYNNENDNSNVIYTELNGYKFMFMGDASSTTEKEILNKYNLPDIDVLKVGHHGSKTSSGKEFINEISPEYSIISVGKNNRYGHPNKEVLNNLAKSKIFRTDENGSIMFKIKNNNIKIEIYSP